MPLTLNSISSQRPAGDQQLRVFGYGSLIWCPGFAYTRRIVGYVRGFQRRFYQGSRHHRGTPEIPGRVATLLPDSRSTVWGVVYEVEGQENVRVALAHLTEREARLGNYGVCAVNFCPLPGAGDAAVGTPAGTVCTFVAEPDNPLYLGEASLEEQARQIAMATGVSGCNADYVRRVAQFMTCEVPEGAVLDPYLADLVNLIDSIDGVRQPRSNLVKSSSARDTVCLTVY